MARTNSKETVAEESSSNCCGRCNGQNPHGSTYSVSTKGIAVAALAVSVLALLSSCGIAFSGIVDKIADERGGYSHQIRGYDDRGFGMMGGYVGGYASGSTSVMPAPESGMMGDLTPEERNNMLNQMNGDMGQIQIHPTR